MTPDVSPTPFETGSPPIPVSSPLAAGPLTRGDADRLRLPEGTVARELLRHPWKFDFFEAVLILQQFAGNRGGNGAAPLGRFSQPSREAMRFAVPDSLVFPGSTIQAVEWNFEDDRPQVRVNFMGLTGPSGILPSTYTERLQWAHSGRRHRERYALRDWLDTFHHRLLSLFFDAWTKYRFPIAIRRQRIEFEGKRSKPVLVRVALAAIGGLDPTTAGVQPSRLDGPAASAPSHDPSRDSGGRTARDEWLGVAGLLAQRPMNVASLEAILRRSLGVPIRVRQFRATWLGLEPESRTALGQANARLGADAVLGERIRSRSQKIRIEVGPLSAAAFRRFLPPTDTGCGDGYRRLVELARISLGPSIEFEIRPLLKIESPLEVSLNGDEHAHRLGIDSWMGSPEGTSVATDATFAGVGGSCGK